MLLVTKEKNGFSATLGNKNTPITNLELSETHIAELNQAKEDFTWLDELKNSVTSLEGLVEGGFMTTSEALLLKSVSDQFEIRIPQYYANLIDRSDLKNCPIAKQALPHTDEDRSSFPDWAQKWCLQAFGQTNPFLSDAIGDVAKLAAPRLTHRYGQRALLHTSTLCSLYCRFCFRKSHLNEKEENLYRGSFGPSLEYLQNHPEISEIILTGGDPLSVKDKMLGKLLSSLSEIPHLKMIRIHSRMPVTMPSRITNSLCTLLTTQKIPVHLVTHFNHPTELTEFSEQKIKLLRRFGILVLNQSVLLKGVNDNEKILEELFSMLYFWGVVPYYLHHPDLTPGTLHFRLPIARGRELMRALAGKLSGPALPSYVLDIPRGHGKINLMETDRFELLDQKSTNEISGALWKIRGPHLKDSSEEFSTYVEFWK